MWRHVQEKDVSMVPLADMTRDQLLEIVDVAERRWAEGPPTDTRRWSKTQMVAYVESLRPDKRAPRKKLAERRATRLKTHRGVGKYCLTLLATITGHTPDGLPIGLSYNRMVRMAQRRFPDSAVDERHLRWYASKARLEARLSGVELVMPVHRKRSVWVE